MTYGRQVAASTSRFSDAQDLRRTFGVLARSGGASRDDVGDVLGNSAGSDPQLGEIYMPPSFDTASRAVMSIRRPTADKRKKA